MCSGPQSIQPCQGMSQAVFLLISNIINSSFRSCSINGTLTPRPISGPWLTSLSKDWNVLSPLNPHLTSNALFESFQSGFWSHHNTKKALLRVTKYLLLSIDLVNSQSSFFLTVLQPSTSSSAASAWRVPSSPGSDHTSQTHNSSSASITSPLSLLCGTRRASGLGTWSSTFHPVHAPSVAPSKRHGLFFDQLYLYYVHLHAINNKMALEML